MKKLYKDQFARHPQVFIESGEQAAWVDDGVATMITALWEAGFETRFSCQGDTHQSAYVIVRAPQPLSPSEIARVTKVLQSCNWTFVEIRHRRILGDCYLGIQPA
jgi:hypothetical protein